MHTAARPYAAAGAALAAASVVAVAPIAPRPPEVPLVSQAIRLVTGESLLNVPFNLFQDFVNIPSTEIGGLQQFADSLLYSGTWWTASATNIWGEDPGDAPHFMSIVDMAVPFKELSGQGMGELQGFGDYDSIYDVDEDAVANGQLGLGQQIALFLNAQIPVSASSDADWSSPLFPVTPITGSTFIDRNLWTFALFSGMQKYPLFDNWFKVPVSDLTSGNFNFGDAVNPSMGVGVDDNGAFNGSVPNDYGFLGTKPLMGDIGYGVNDAGQALNENGNPVNLMPWSNLDFKFDPSYAFQHYWDSLQQAPDMNGFELPNFEDFGRALQTMGAASILAYYPYVPGSPACPMDGCDMAGPFSPTTLIKNINDLWPGNTSIEHWLDLTAQDGLGPFGDANGPTDHQVDFAGAWAQSIQQWFDLGNPSPEDTVGNVDTPITFEISPAMQNLINFAEQSGIQDFFQNWADIAGYQPIDPNDLLGSLETADALTTAAVSPDWFADVLGDFGLGDLATLF